MIMRDDDRGGIEPQGLFVDFTNPDHRSIHRTAIDFRDLDQPVLRIQARDPQLLLVGRVGEAVLPPPPALRTVRVRFRTHGSSLGNAPCGTRLRYR